MGDAEKYLKEQIISRYGNLNRFCDEIDMPWTTLDSILKRGILKANITNVLKISRALGISAELLASGGEPTTSDRPTPAPLSSHEQEHIRKYRRLDEKGQHAVDVVTDMEYGRVVDEDRKKAAPASAS